MRHITSTSTGSTCITGLSRDAVRSWLDLRQGCSGRVLTAAPHGSSRIQVLHGQGHSHADDLRNPQRPGCLSARASARTSRSWRSTSGTFCAIAVRRPWHRRRKPAIRVEVHQDRGEGLGRQSRRSPTSTTPGSTGTSARWSSRTTVIFAEATRLGEGTYREGPRLDHARGQQRIASTS